MVTTFKNFGEWCTAKNCHPVNRLSVVSKVFGKLINNRIIDQLMLINCRSSDSYIWYNCYSGATRAVALDDLNQRLLRGFGMLVFFTNISLMECQVRYLVLFLLGLVIDGFEWFWMGSLCKNIQLMLLFLKAPYLVIHFSYYTLMIFLIMLSVVLLSMMVILLFVATARIGFWIWIWSMRQCRFRQELTFLFQCWENSTGFFWPV